MEDGYCIKWEKHHNAVVSVFDDLYTNNILVDCTLAAENKFIKAHRIVLMACSPYFEDLLSQHCDNYPIVWLNMKFKELQALVDFCYRGEVRLSQAELPGFLNAARLIQINGLCNSTEKVRKRKQSEECGSQSAGKRKYKSSDGSVKDNSAYNDYMSGYEDFSGAEDNDSFHNIVQTNGDSMLHVQGDDNSDRSDLDTDEESSGGEEKGSLTLDDLMKPNSGLLCRWRCPKCGKAFSTRALYQEHKKGCTADPSVDHPWRCHKCPNTYKNKKDLVRHLLYCGNETERHICERCGSSYKYERGLKRHKIYCGTDVKPMVCIACGKTYKYKRGLRRHQKQQCGLIQSFIENRSKMSAEDVDGLMTKLAVNKNVSTPKPVSSPSKNPEPDDTTPDNTPQCKDAYAPAVCQSCGKVYKYKKPYLNHIINCVPSEQNTNENEEEDLKKPDATDIEVDDVHASQEPDPMDDKTMEKEIDELVAFKKVLESEETTASDNAKQDDEESQNNNVEELDEKEDPKETIETI